MIAPTETSTSPTTVFTRPENLFADRPAESRGVARDAVRLLVATPGGIVHTTFNHLGEHLSPGDVVVVNTSATIAGQLDVTTSSGTAEVLHLAGRPDGNRLDGIRHVVELRTAPDAARAVLDHEIGDRLQAGGATLTLREPYAGQPASPTGRGNRLWLAEVDDPRALDNAVAIRGRPISYGYLADRPGLAAYQTIFSRDPGSAEMPSAARPFTHAVALDLLTRGVQIAPLLLHTGVSSQEVGEPPQREWFAVPESTANLVNAARVAGRRVVAVGTTVTRALESAVDGDAAVARSGWTDLILGPLHPPRLITGLVSGWHDPQASHLLLVESVAGADLTQQAYDAAVREGYLWHEFGDSSLFLP